MHLLCLYIFYRFSIVQISIVSHKLASEVLSDVSLFLHDPRRLDIVHNSEFIPIQPNTRYALSYWKTAFNATDGVPSGEEEGGAQCRTYASLSREQCLQSCIHQKCSCLSKNYPIIRPLVNRHQKLCENDGDTCLESEQTCSARQCLPSCYTEQIYFAVDDHETETEEQSASVILIRRRQMPDTYFMNTLAMDCHQLIATLGGLLAFWAVVNTIVIYIVITLLGLCMQFQKFAHQR